MRTRSFLCFLSLALAASPLLADPPVGWLRPFWLRSPANMNGCPPLPCLPDDYCRKPFPSLSDVPRCGGVNDYCRKPFPDLSEILRCGGPDDYCRKPMPTLLCPLPWCTGGEAGK